MSGENFFSNTLKVNNSEYPRQKEITFQYGTAGIRYRGDVLGSAMFRLGVLAGLRSKLLGKQIGLMVTASHNPEHDNGVKLVDPMGEMMDQSWETFATEIVNADDDKLVCSLERLVDATKVPLDAEGNIIVGCDTRDSSPGLLSAAIKGAESIGVAVRNLQVVTTPQLHFVVRCTNDPSYGAASLDGYYQKISTAFNNLVQQCPSLNNYRPSIHLDCANGVGAPRIKELITLIENNLKFDLFHSGEGKLNFECGADFVKVCQKPPTGTNLIPKERYASLDGDADRIVYYFADEQGIFRLLDGDRIATLLAGFIKKLLDMAGISGLNIAIVQTAYANGGSTNYITDVLKVPVKCVPTGVKHLHHEAMKSDVGVYFEANGHGTIVFSDNTKAALRNVLASGSEEAKTAANNLLSFIDLTNETVGDAITDLLLVEIVLRYLDMDVSQWYQEYVDLPCRQLKVSVQDRNRITTTDAERICVTPEGLQSAIDQLVSKYTLARSFVRPSGTEDVVRVYSEASTQEDCDQLGKEVAQKVFELAGGVGTRP